VIIFNGKESSQESFRIWAIHQRRTFCQEMPIVSLSFSYSKRETWLGKWHEPRKVGDLLSSSLLAWKRENAKRLIRKAWTLARQKGHPHPASDRITIRNWIQNHLQQSEIKKLARIKSVSILLHIFHCVSWAWRIPRNWEPRWSRCFYNRYRPTCHVHHPFTSQHAFTHELIHMLSFLGVH
jgi:hypothetical protein